MSNTLPPGWVPPNLENDPNADPDMDHALNLNPEGQITGYQNIDYFRKIAEGDHSSRRIREGVATGDDRLSSSLVPIEMEFGVGVVDSPSAPKTATLTNTGVDPIDIVSIDTVGDYEYNTNCGSSLAPGASCQIQVVFVPKRNGEHSGGLVVDLGSAGKEVIQFTGAGTGQVITPPEPETPQNTPTINIADATLRIGASTGFTLPGSSLALGMMTEAGSASKKFRILGSSLGPVPMTALPQSGSGFTITYAVAENGAYSAITSYTIAQNDDLWVQISYSGNSAVPASRDLTFTGGGKSVTVKATAAAYSEVPVDPDPEPEDPVAITRRIRIAGNQFYRATNNNTDQGGTLPAEGGIMLKSVNLFGAEGENAFFHGLWQRPWKAMLDQVKALGMNCIRYPLAGGHVRTNPVLATPPLGANTDVVGKTTLQFLDMVIDYCQEIGLYVVLDHHRRTPGAGTDGGYAFDYQAPINYTKANWHNAWSILANRYKDKVNVVGADVHNEPHHYTWAEWAPLVEEVAEVIHAIAPNWIIFAEGVGNEGTDHYWWGGHLKGVIDRPIELGIPNRLCYSPHEYGQSVGSQTWQQRDNGPVVPNYPNNLPAIWDEYWGFIYWNNIAPIWIGEMGGHFGLNADTGVIDKPHATYETQWMQTLVRYLNGDKNADGTMQSSEVAALAGSKKGMSWAWWGWPPISGDTGGLVRADYQTLQAPKVALIQPLLNVTP